MQFTENSILDEDYRAEIIKEIDGPENVSRKNIALKKHEIYRDKVKKWVVQALEKEGYKQTTLAQMSNRAANVSICRRIIEKLARNYVKPPKRTSGSQEAVDLWSDELDFNTKMKKADRYRQLFRNCLVHVVPIPETAESTPEKTVYKLQVKVLPPWAYDVIEDPNDPHEIAALILSEHVFRDAPVGDSYVNNALGYHTAPRVSIDDPSDGIDQKIADSPSDKDRDTKNRRFIWWTRSYHLTTDAKGKVLPDESPEGLLNPIGILPCVNIAGDQDGSFWAEGGDDVPESSILLNKIMTDINFISFVQGWGQLVIAGKDLPKNIEGGPNNAMIFDIDKPDDPMPQVFYATSNPPISSWLETLKTTLAMLLSTNGLSTRNISATLDATEAMSGVAMLVEQSEVVEFNQDVQMLFQDKEPEIWERIEAWRAQYALTDQLVEVQRLLPEISDPNVSVQFLALKPPISEGEMLDALKKRKDLGIVSLEDLLRLDNPDLTDEQIAERAQRLREEKQQNAAAFGLPEQDAQDQDESEDDSNEPEMEEDDPE